MPVKTFELESKTSSVIGSGFAVTENIIGIQPTGTSVSDLIYVCGKQILSCL